MLKETRKETTFTTVDEQSEFALARKFGVDVGEEAELAEVGWVAVNYVDEQGFVVDAVTDIPVEHVQTMSSPVELTPEERGEFLTSVLHQLDSRTVSLLEAKEAEIARAVKRITAYYDDKIKRQERRRRWLLVQHWIYVYEHAKAWLHGKKERSIKTVFGAYGFRKQLAKIVVKEGVLTKQADTYDRYEDPDVRRLALVQWAVEHCPQAVKVTEEFQVSKLPKGVDFSTLPAEFFEQIPESDNFYVDSGAGLGRITHDDVLEPEPANALDGDSADGADATETAETPDGEYHDDASS